MAGFVVVKPRHCRCHASAVGSLPTYLPKRANIRTPVIDAGMPLMLTTARSALLQHPAWWAMGRPYSIVIGQVDTPLRMLAQGKHKRASGDGCIEKVH